MQAEINRLREWKMETNSGRDKMLELFTARESKASSETDAVGSLLAPVPSPQSQVPTQASQHHFSLTETATGKKTPKTNNRENEARTLGLELLKRMMETATSMFHGSSAEAREQLDAATKEHLQNYYQDQTNAKIEVFGYEISEEEIEDIPEPRRKLVRKKMETIIRRGTEVRYKAQLTAGRNVPEMVTCVGK